MSLGVHRDTRDLAEIHAVGKPREIGNRIERDFRYGLRARRPGQQQARECHNGDFHCAHKLPPNLWAVIDRPCSYCGPSQTALQLTPCFGPDDNSSFAKEEKLYVTV